MSSENPYMPVTAEIQTIVSETPSIKTFVLRPREEVHFRTGQFVELTLPGLGEAPFTPSSSPQVRETLDITVMKAGRVTALLHEMHAGQALGVRGPFGAGYPVDNFVGREVLIVGGGCGLAPLKSLVLALFARQGDFKRILLRYGAKTPADIPYKRELEDWSGRIDVKLTVDVGSPEWTGSVGVVTRLLDEVDVDRANAAVIICGPPIMMMYATRRVLELGFPPSDIWLSMEKNMSCGIGKCGHCRLGAHYVCKDGPVFRYDDIKDLPEIWV
jgi:sulfite reductase subunit B